MHLTPLWGRPLEFCYGVWCEQTIMTGQAAHFLSVQYNKNDRFVYFKLCTVPTLNNMTRTITVLVFAFESLNIKVTGSSKYDKSARLCIWTTTLCLKKDTDVAHYNFIAHQQISAIFGRCVAERVCYQMVICYHTSPNYCFCTTWGNMNMNPGNCVFLFMLYTVSRKRHCSDLPYLRYLSTNFNNLL